MTNTEALDDLAARIGRTRLILAEITRERLRQHELFGDQSHLPDGGGTWYDKVEAERLRHECDRAQADGTWTFAHILAEEAAEVLAESDPEKRRVELIQLGALCIQGIEIIDGRAGLPDPLIPPPAPLNDRGPRECLLIADAIEAAIHLVDDDDAAEQLAKLADQWRNEARS